MLVTGCCVVVVISCFLIGVSLCCVLAVVVVVVMRCLLIECSLCCGLVVVWWWLFLAC